MLGLRNGSNPQVQMQEELLHQLSGGRKENLIIQEKFPHNVTLAQPVDVVLHLAVGARIQASNPRLGHYYHLTHLLSSRTVAGVLHT